MLLRIASVYTDAHTRVLFHMLTGAIPYAHPTQYAVLTLNHHYQDPASHAMFTTFSLACLAGYYTVWGVVPGTVSTSPSCFPPTFTQLTTSFRLALQLFTLRSCRSPTPSPA
eukprot:1294737-Rhodomonas_salina.2